MKKRKIVLRDQLAEMFRKAGYIVKYGSFSDNSASWLSITKRDDPNFILELSFNFKGSKFKDFNVWEEIIDVVDTVKIL